MRQWDGVLRNKILRIYCKKSDASFDLIVRTGERRTVVLVDASTKDCPYVEVEIPEGTDNVLTIQMLRHHTEEKDFELYGVSLESAQKSGLMLHCLGIGGAHE